MTDVDHERPRLDRAALEQLLAGLTAVRGGDFSTRLALTGDPLVDEIAAVFNRMVDQLDQFTSEVTRVAREVGTEGKLGGQADVRDVAGTWKDLTDSVNSMAGNLTSQVRNIADVTCCAKMASVVVISLSVSASAAISPLASTPTSFCVRSRQVPATPATLAWPPSLPSVPTSRATLVTSAPNEESWSTIVLTVLAVRRNSPCSGRPSRSRAIG